MAGGGGLEKTKICHTSYNDETWHSYIYLKKIQKIYESRDTPFEFYWRQHFFTENQQMLLCQEMQIYIAFWYIVSNSFKFSQVFKDCFNKYGYNFDDVNKNGYVGLLNIKLIWSRGYDVIIYVHGVTNKILSRDSNYILDAVVWPKFGNSSISTREVIITSIL